MNANEDHPTLFIIKSTGESGHVVYATCDAEEAITVSDEWEELHGQPPELIECTYATDMAGWKPIVPPFEDLEWPIEN